MLTRLREIGPGALVAAAFIGPGTVTTATLAGVRFEFSLLWALTFSIVATLILQEMSARLGLVTGKGLGEAIRSNFEGAAREEAADRGDRGAGWRGAGWRGAGRIAAILLVGGAVVVGNAAYQTGNLLGGSLGLEALLGGDGRAWAGLLGVVAFLLLWTGSYRVVERALVALVILMSVVFVTTAAVLLPPAGALLEGMFVPRLPRGADALVALGLVGTTVVPYNLFLHAAAVRERWAGPESLPVARLDAFVAIVLGGIVSMAIVVTAAGSGAERVESAADMAVQLEPLLGAWARAFFATGLLAAGLSSSVTAPLAAAYAAAGIMGWERNLRSPRFRAVWILVLGTGLAFAFAGVRPVPAILFAQVANGLLLPAVAVFLLWAANSRLMGEWRNGPVLNVAAGVVVLLAAALGLRAILGAF